MTLSQQLVFIKIQFDKIYPILFFPGTVIFEYDLSFHIKILANKSSKFSTLKISFIDFASPSTTDREHMDEVGHAALADAIYDKITALEKGLANVI